MRTQSLQSWDTETTGIGRRVHTGPGVHTRHPKTGLRVHTIAAKADTMDVTTIIIACRQQAKAQKLSLAQVAKQVGVDRSLVGHWFNARRTPSADKLFALMDALGLQVQLVTHHTPKATNTGALQAKECLLPATITSSISSHKPKPKRSKDQSESGQPSEAKKTLPAKKIKPIRKAPAFENLTPTEIETARKLFNLDLSGNV